jgi:two-component system, sporulation sensor kinase A
MHKWGKMPSQPVPESITAATGDRRVAEMQGEAIGDQAILNSLRDGIAFLRRHLQGLGVGLGLFSADWTRVAFVTGTFERIFACTRDELEAEPTRWMRCVDRQDAPLIQDLFDTAAPGESKEATYRVHCQGQTRWIHSHCLLAMAESKSPHLLVSFEDITDRRLAEIAMQDSEAKYRRIVETTSEGIIIVDAEWRISFVNEQAAEFAGTTPDEMTGKYVMDYIHPDVVPSINEILDRRRLGVKENYQTKIRLVNGTERWLKVAGSPMLDDEGRFIGSLAMMLDITAQTRAEQAVRDSQAQFRTLAVHSPVGIFQCDLQGNSLFVNNRYLAISGLTEGEAVGQGWLKTLHPLDRVEVLADGAHALQCREEFSREFRFLHGNGTVCWVWANAIPMCDENGRVTSLLGNVLDITERKKTEEALRASEQRFRLLSNSSPVGIFVTDEAGQLVYSNPRMQAIYGYDAQQLSGLGFTRSYYPDDYATALANWLRIAQSTEAHDLDRRFIRANGEKRWAHVQSAAMLSPDGTVLGRVGTVEDITDRRQALLELQISEARYRMLADYSTDMISKHATDSTMLYVSPACRTLLGYEPEELVGKKVDEFLHPDDQAAYDVLNPTGADSTDVVTLAFRFRRKDGVYVWLEVMFRTILGLSPEGQQNIVAVSRDITERRQAADRLRESEARLRGILDTVADGIVTVNDSLIIERFNPGAQRLFGYTTDEILGRHLGLLIPGAKLADFRKNVRRSRHSTHVPAREVTGQLKDGTICDLEIRVGTMEFAGHTVYTAVLHDISDRKRTEQMLRENEKLAATGRIAARIAHEINNPLAGIRNSFLLIKDGISPDHPYFSYVNRIETEIDRIARIVRQMFDLHRPDYVMPQEVDLRQTLGDVVALLDCIAQARGVTLSVDSAGVARRVSLSEDALRQVLYNLIVNAIEASPASSEVRVTATVTDSEVEVLVADQGDGIPSALQSQIYEPFFTTKSQSGTGGLGLGLPISKGLVEAMQGTLAVERTSHRGTVFRVAIPICEPGFEVENG